MKILQLLLFFFSLPLSAQWINIGPGGGEALCFAQKNDTIFLGTQKGIYYSSDKGNSWVSASNGLTTNRVNTILVSNNTIYAGTSGGGIFVSSDNGKSWSTLNNGLSGNTLYIKTLIVHNNILFAGSSPGVLVYNTVDNSWKLTTKGITFPSALSCNKFLQNSNDLFLASNQGVFKFNFSDSSWESRNNGLVSQGIDAFTSTDSIFFVGCRAGQGRGIYYSTDTCKSWTFLYKPLQGVTDLAVAGQKLLVGTDGGIEVSNSTLTNWTLNTNGISANVINSLWVSDNGVFAAAKEGAYFSDTKGDSWSSKNTGLSDVNVYSLTKYNNQLLAGIYGLGIMKYDESTGNWTKQDNGITVKNVTSLLQHNNKLFASTFGGGLYTSSNNGSDWVHLDSGVAYTSMYKIASNGNQLFACGSGGAFITSDNNGTFWKLADTTLPKISFYNILAKGDTVILCGQYGNIFISKNKGQQFQQTNIGLPDIPVYALAIKGDTFFAGSDSGVFIMTGLGGLWKQSNSGLSNVRIRSLVIYGNSIFAGTYGGVYISIDNGNSWAAVNTNLPSATIVRNFLFDYDRIYIASSGGVWKRGISEITSSKDFKTENFSFDIYPNPTNGNFTIQLNNLSEFVERIEVISTLGNGIYSSLVSKDNNNIAYTISLDGKIPSGIYFVSLKTEKGIFTRRILIQ